MPRCAVCGTDELLAFKCTYCGKTHCGAHRLPESHLCPEIELAAEARLMRERLGGSGVRTVRAQGAAGGRAASMWSAVEGKFAIAFLVAAVAFYVLELVVLAGDGDAMCAGADVERFSDAFVLDKSWPTKPWTLVTSVFSHDPCGFTHLLYNGIALFFFGPLLERRIGSRRFALLFIGGGVLAGLAQVHLLQEILGSGRGVLGASGGIMAIAGTLAMLAPGLRVLLMFIVPVPMWALVMLYAFLDLAGLGAQATVGGNGIAHIAHLTGLALGLGLGLRWRGQGFRFPGEMGHAFRAR